MPSGSPAGRIRRCCRLGDIYGIPVAGLAKIQSNSDCIFHPNSSSAKAGASGNLAFEETVLVSSICPAVCATPNRNCLLLPINIAPL